jgi:hypothetical protein
MNTEAAMREQIIKSFKPAFQLECAVCLSIVLAFAVTLLVLLHA